MAIETLSEQLFYTTVHITSQTPLGLATGTGFLCSVPKDGGFSIVLVTNKHVLADATQVRFQMVRAGRDGQPTSDSCLATFEDFGPASWIGHPDPSVDVAALPFTMVLQGWIAAGTPAFFRHFEDHTLMTDEVAVNLDAIEAVTFIGYPSGIFDQFNFTPVARRGHTATPPTIDYEGKPAFLVDASVFPGSSGSPVIIADEGMVRSKTGGLAFGQSRLILLGVIAAVHTRQIDGPVAQIPTSQLIASIDEPIDLGIVFKAKAIRECIDLVLARTTPGGMLRP